MQSAATNPSTAVPFTPSATTWLRLAMVYLIAGASLGIVMGASGSFTPGPVLSHLALLGVTTAALTGLVYGVYPKTGERFLAALYFWLHNVALPAMMVSLTFVLLGHSQVAAIFDGSEFVTVAGVFVFAFNLYRDLYIAARQSTHPAKS